MHGLLHTYINFSLKPAKEEFFTRNPAVLQQFFSIFSFSQKIDAYMRNFRKKATKPDELYDGDAAITSQICLPIRTTVMITNNGFT